MLSGCATPGPLVPLAPAIRFVSFGSAAIQPEGIQFEVKIEIKNRMPVTLPLDRIDYQFDLNHKRLLTGSFNRFQAFGGNSQQVVTLPFRLAWEDIVRQSQDQGQGPEYHVAFRGSLYISGVFSFAAIPFEIERSLPVPKLPEFGFAGTEGSPLESRFAVNFKVRNNNRFPMWIERADASLWLNGKSYSLVHGGKNRKLEPGDTQVLSLAMTNTLSKGIGMLANVLISGKTDFQVKGRLHFGTPFGDISVPLDIKGRTD